LHARLVLSRIGNEFLQILRGEVLAREQNERRLGDQDHRCEIGRGIIKRIPVERLIGSMRTHIAQDEQVPVRRGFGHTRAADHASRAADILDDDLLAQEIRNSRAQNARDRVCRASGRERNDHGQRSRRPFLRSGRSVRRSSESNRNSGCEGPDYQAHSANIPTRT
jgi:hypothetical protein